MVVRGATRARKRPQLPRFVWGAAVAVAIVLLGGAVLLWRGCGRGGSDPYGSWGGMSKEEFLQKRKERAEAETKKEAEEAKRAAETKKKADEAKKKAEEEAKRLAAGKKAKPERRIVTSDADEESDQPVAGKAPQLPMVPNEFTEWKDFDYFVARLSGNPRLALAVEYRSQNTPRDEQQAEFFRKLLAPQLLAELKAFAGSRRPAAGHGGDAPTAAIEAIAAALGRNGTAPARRTLGELLAGTLSVENDQAAVAAALKALGLHPSEENDRVLVLSLVEPEKLRAPGQGQVTPEALRKQAMAAIEQHGKSGVRLLAAQRFVDPACSPEVRKLLAPLWAKPHPENLEAYVLLNERGELDEQARSQILKHLVGSSGRAIRHFLGILGTAEGREATGADPDLPFRIAGLLWKADFARVIDARRTTVRSMDEARDLVLLAATVPRSDVRSRVLRVLERRWEEGPTALKSGGYAETVVAEPGILAVLKSVRRGRPVAPQANLKTRGIPNQKQQKDPWLDFEEALLRDFCRRFSEAAVSPNRGDEAKPRPPAGSAEEGRQAAFPVALHPRAEVVAEYRVQWPGCHAAKLTAISPEPMDVAYVRMEQKARPWSVRGHYERSIKGSKAHPIRDGIWIETILPAAKEGRTRSIDVLLTRANPKADTPSDETQELTVEILCVAIPSLETSSGAKRRAPTDPEADASP